MPITHKTYKKKREKHLTLLIQYLPGCLWNWIWTCISHLYLNSWDFTAIQTEIQCMLHR